MMNPVVRVFLLLSSFLLIINDLILLSLIYRIPNTASAMTLNAIKNHFENEPLVWHILLTD